ncbi:hypothetical protein [Xylocopilactobacillus apis]|uniref:Uncharacterized protein n=1 Tax=Xylocopilactobacillus apis TaxID=2932183 RepID=A0AAU9D3X9_9LACO|nr:hypothetical protein [Xylocopilactobacillus apis]BDR57050.1 hypothetical protein KIMC2_16120 [Xylocopilactobacillus apis]
MVKYFWPMFFVDLIVTFLMLKSFNIPAQNYLADFLIYIAFAVVWTVVLLLVSSKFRNLMFRTKSE